MTTKIKIKSDAQTIVVDNFRGAASVQIYGDMNSGLGSNTEAYGYDPILRPGLLRWAEAPTQIDAAGAVITDLIMDGKTRVESGITYVYAIGHTGRVYKIQVNNPATYNPDYDNPVLLATLSINSPTFTRGGFIDFCGTPEQIFIGHDKGVTSIHFDGTTEAFLGVLGTWTQLVPRPFQQFVGKLYVGNGSNIAEIDISGTGSVTTYTKLSPSFPSNTQVRDLDVTPDGNYLQAVVTDLALSNITATVPDTSIIAPSNSYTFIWNGTDIGYTSTTSYPSTVLSSAIMFGSHQYVFGYDFLGCAVYDPTEKMITSIPLGGAMTESPFPNAVVATTNMVTWATTWNFQGSLVMVWLMYGTFANYDVPDGFWTPLSPTASAPETDILHIPCQIAVSNYAQGSSSNGYPSHVFGTPKIYYSTLETSVGTTAYKFYKFRPVSGFGAANVGSLYQSQIQPFSKKVKATEIRIYGFPWVSGNSFQVDLVGADDTVIAGTTQVFTAGTNLTIGSDYAWYSPVMSPRYSFGFRITNLGTVNHTIAKLEIDYVKAGK